MVLLYNASMSRLKRVLEHANKIDTNSQPNRDRVLYVAKKYRITADDYLAMALKQGGGCAICGGRDGAGKQRRAKYLAVDHCHDSERVRGLLCANCNLGLGNFKDSIELLRLAIAYLERDRK